LSSFYNVITTLQPTAANQQQAESFAQQYLSAAYPDTDFREGTGLYDTVIRPAGSLFALVEAAINFYFSNYTLQGANNNTPTNFVDAILSNWFSTRQQGTQAVINATLYFAAQVPVTLTTNQVFSPDGVTTFSPINSAVYPASNLSYDAARQEWYLNVNLQATGTGSNFNLNSGTLMYFTNFNPFFLSGAINYLVSSGLATETNSEFIARTQAEISTRNLINRNSIESFLTNTFPELTNMAIVGYGDPAMQRDYVTVYSVPASANVDFHMGGYVDIYTQTPVTSGYQTITLDASGNGFIGGAVYSTSNAGSGAGSTVTVPASASYTTSWPGSIVSPGTVIPSGDVLFSSQQMIQVSFGSAYANAVAGLTVSSFQSLDSYQSGVSQPGTRVLCANYLIREPSTYFLDITLTSASNVPYSGNPLTVAQNYIAGLALGQVFSVGDFLNLLQMPGLLMPVTINYTYYGTDGTEITGSFSDYAPHQTSTSGTAVNVTNFTTSPDPVPPTGLFQFVLNSVSYLKGV
jgi:hypothetical protein